MWVGTHPAVALRSEFGQLGPEPTATVEEFRGLIALHPFFEDSHVSWVIVHFAHRHLVGAPIAFGAPTIDFFWARPALGCAQNDHWPARALGKTIHTRIGLDALDFRDDGVECGGHQLV